MKNPISYFLFFIVLNLVFAFTGRSQQVIIETGIIEVSSHIKSISLNHTFNNPIVIAGPATNLAGAEVIPKISNITASSFDIELEVLPNSSPLGLNEKVSYLVIEEGVYEFTNGLTIQAGKTNTNSGIFQNITFPIPYTNTPVVFSQVQATLSSPSYLRTRHNGISASQFSVKLEREESNNMSFPLANIETIGYLAINEYCGNLQDLKLQIGTGITSSTLTNQLFTNSCKDKSLPIFLGNIQSTNGSEPGVLRVSAYTSNSFSYFFEEDKSSNVEQIHAFEEAGWMALWNENNSLIYAPGEPQLFNVFPITGPTVGGTQINLSGINLDTTISGWALEFDGNLIPKSEISYLNEEELVFILPPGVGTKKVIELSVKNETVVAPLLFDYALPEITSTSTNFQNTQGGYEIEIFGENFGIDINEVSAFLDNETITITDVTQTKVTGIIPAGTGINKDVQLTIGGQMVIAKDAFSYDPPMAFSFTGTSPTFGLNPFVISGDNFGINANDIQVFIGNKPAIVTSAAHTTIIGNIPEGVGSHLDVTIILGMDTITLPAAFSYQTSVISQLDPAPFPTTGGTMDINGLNFGNIIDSVQVFLQGNSLKINSVNHQSINVDIPEGTGAMLDLQVIIAGEIANGGGSIFNYAIPTVASISPSTGPTTGGNELTILGNNFGRNIADVLFTIDGNQAQILNVTHNQITLLAPPGSGIDKVMSLTIGGQQVSLASLYNYLSPVLTTFTNNCLKSGETINLLGENFGPSGTFNLNVNGANAVINEISDTRINFTIPDMLLPSNNITFSVDGQVSNSLLLPECTDKMVKMDQAVLLIESRTSGLIFKTLDGTCWKVFVNIDGEIISQKVDCP